MSSIGVVLEDSDTLNSPFSFVVEPQVVPSCASPVLVDDGRSCCIGSSGEGGAGSSKSETRCQRKLPDTIEGVKLLNWFTEDDIFAGHEE